MSLNSKFRILIADRNRHVREFLRREFLEAGYRVEVARDGREILQKADGGKSIHLLILDPETPYVGELEVLSRIREYHPGLPVVIYTFPGESAEIAGLDQAAVRLDKDGDTERLKAAVAETLNHHYPQLSRPKR